MIGGAETRRLVVVTGSSGGLGRAICLWLVAREYSVVGIARSEVRRSDIGPSYRHVQADLSDVEGIPELVRRVVGDFGVPYGLVNNAAGASDGLLPLVPDREIARALQLDLVSPIVLTRHFSRGMIAGGSGRIVNITSIVAATGYRGLSVYSAAKAGLEGFSRSLARDLGARGVTVNCVAPGFLDTPMTNTFEESTRNRVLSRSPMKRPASLDEVAAAVGYFLSDQAGGTTGTVLTVDAGATA